MTNQTEHNLFVKYNFISQQLTKYGGTSLYIICLFGTIMNILLFSQGVFNRRSCSLYLLAASTCDFIHLNLGLLSNILQYGFHYNWTINSNVYCKTKTYFVFVFTIISATLTTLAGVDRYMLSSQKSAQWNYSRRSVSIRCIKFTIFFWFIISIPIIFCSERFHHSSQNEQLICSNSYRHLSCLLVQIIYVCLFNGFLPPFIMMIFGCFTYNNIRRLYQRSKVRSIRVRQINEQFTSMLILHLIKWTFASIPYSIFNSYWIITMKTYKSLAHQAIENLINQIVVLLFWKLALLLCNLADYTIGDAPNFLSAYGLTVRSVSQLNKQLYEVVVSSDEVRGNQTIRILVPPDYTTSGKDRRYPVLYLLHGASGGATDWTTAGTAQEICGNASLITVMPNGDPFGFYTNWVIPGNATPQNWRTYHMEQLVPWVDFNLRTVARKQGRAIAGLSMGGFGSIHYAELYSQNFVYAASFSGALDLLDVRVQNIILNLVIIDDKPLVGPFGYPSAPVSSNGWFAQDTITRAAKLHDISVALYTGSAGTLESTLRDGSYRLHDLLVLFNIPVYLNDYGNGQSIGHGCDGGHDWPCWKATLTDVLPRMMVVLQQQF